GILLESDASNTRNKAKDNGRRPGKQEEPKALVTLEGDGVDWTGHSEDDKSSDIKDSPLNDRYAKGMHAVPSPMTGIYMPPRYDFGTVESMSTYGLKQSKTSESDTKTSNFASCDSNSSVETLESVPKPVANEPKAVSEPKVWSDAPIIEEYELDSDDEHVTIPSNKQKKPSFAFVNTVKHVKTPRPRNNVYKSHSPIKRPFTRTTAPKDNFSYHKVNTAWDKIVSDVGGNRETVVKASTECNWRPKRHYWNKVSKYNSGSNSSKNKALKNKGIVDSGCSRHMTRNKAYLADYQDYNHGPIAIGGSKGHIIGKGKIRTGKLDFEDVCFVKELQHFNIFSVSQMCDKKNKVLFTDTECLVPSPNFKFPDENQVLLRVPRQNNMYSFNLENIVPIGSLACLIAKSTVDESNKCHRRLGQVNFKNLNKLVNGNLVKGLPSKIFQNNHNCVAFQKGKQHKASCMAKLLSSISQPLQLLHMDLFGPTSVRSINHKTYCLVITDDFSRFSRVFFLRTKDETSGILKDFLRQIENQLNQKVKTIICDNGTEFKNKDIIEFYGSKGINREYNSFLPNTFWAEAVSTACYVLNRVLVTKPQNKTPYELITGKIPIISYIRPFGCHVTILNTIDHLGKFDGKSDEGFLVRYSLNSKAFRSVRSKNHANQTARPKEANHSAEAKNGGEKPKKDTGLKSNEKPIDQEEQAFLKEFERLKRQEKEANDEAEALRKESAKVSTTSPSRVFSVGKPSSPYSTIYADQDDSHIPALEDIYDHLSNGIFSNASYDDEGAVADFTNLETNVNVSPIPRLRIHFIHPTTQILGDSTSAVQTRSKVNKSSRAHAFGHRQEEGIDYDEVFAPVARIEAIKIFLAFASFMGFIVYQMDVKSVFLYDTIDDEVYMTQPLGFVDPKYPQKKSWCVEFEALMKSRFQMSSMGELTFFLGLQTASAPIETKNPLTKDEEDADVDVHLYRSMIGSLMYLTASRPDIMFAEAYSDSDYARAILDRKSTTRGCQFLGRRLISWQCKKQTVVATSTIEAEYVAVANCCGQVLWIQNQMLDYGFNFMNTDIYIDNESTICIVKNLVFHSKTKHITIRHHFIRDAYEKKLIRVLKIHTDDNKLCIAGTKVNTARLGLCCLKMFYDGYVVETLEQALRETYGTMVCTKEDAVWIDIGGSKCSSEKKERKNECLVIGFVEEKVCLDLQMGGPLN
nr:putative ribonuclease H-like domain-containing protein [Tanacetum cinerariifolium]